ncbi:Gar1/Naf1 RNA binding region-domain-containing protein [Gaertneriomyces semiglobifer]|nr:Gar1/Naf1 RNA binding region-domain-containing protein [Gaertneriomyces semiglobifer]
MEENQMNWIDSIVDGVLADTLALGSPKTEVAVHPDTDREQAEDVKLIDTSAAPEDINWIEEIVGSTFEAATGSAGVDMADFSVDTRPSKLNTVQQYYDGSSSSSDSDPEEEKATSASIDKPLQIPLIEDISSDEECENITPAVDNTAVEPSDFEFSNSSSSASDSEDDVVAPILSLAEREKRLVQMDESGLDGDDIHGIKGQLSTKNELSTLPPMEPIPFPIPEHLAMEQIGHVYGYVDGMLIVQANASGEQKVLDADSAMFHSNRQPIGRVWDIFGPVTRPMYSVRLVEDETTTNKQIPAQSATADTDGNSKEDSETKSMNDGNTTDAAATPVATTSKPETGTPVFVIPSLASYVLTEALKRQKGSDASNLWDEEVGDDEMEFSDDEKEMEWKRNKKRLKAGNARYEGDGNGEGNRPPSVGGGYQGMPRVHSGVESGGRMPPSSGNLDTQAREMQRGAGRGGRGRGRRGDAPDSFRRGPPANGPLPSDYHMASLSYSPHYPSQNQQRSTGYTPQHNMSNLPQSMSTPSAQASQGQPFNASQQPPSDQAQFNGGMHNQQQQLAMAMQMLAQQPALAAGMMTMLQATMAQQGMMSSGPMNMNTNMGMNMNRGFGGSGGRGGHGRGGHRGRGRGGYHRGGPQ